MLIQLMESLFATTGPALALAWLLKSVLTHRLLKDAEVFKAKLTADTSLQLEQFRAALQRENRESEIRFSALHARLDERLAELYGALVTALEQVTALMVSANLFGRKDALGPPSDFAELQRQAWNAVTATQTATRLLGGVTLYLQSELAKTVKKTIDHLYFASAGVAIGPIMLPHTIGTLLDFSKATTDEARVKLVYDWWLGDDWARAHWDALQSIESAFRDLLGSERRVVSPTT